MNGSSVTAKMAGIESTAKTRSVVSTKTTVRKSGVAAQRAVWAPGGASRTTRRAPHLGH